MLNILFGETMRNIKILVFAITCSLGLPTQAATNVSTPIKSNACSPYILDLANLGKVSLATYLAMSTIYGPRVVARLGAFVGGTPLIGATLIGFMGSQGAAELLNKYVFYGNSESDAVARTATYAGAAIGTAVTVGAIVATATAAPAVAVSAAATTSTTVARAATDALVTPAIAALMFGVLAYEFNCMLNE